jgi:hypothetical protein
MVSCRCWSLFKCGRTCAWLQAHAPPNGTAEGPTTLSGTGSSKFDGQIPRRAKQVRARPFSKVSFFGPFTAVYPLGTIQFEELAARAMAKNHSKFERTIELYQSQCFLR